jgi:hypothetical protein
MKQLIELGAVRIGAAIQNICTNVDFDVLSLPGGSLIAVVLWLYASASGSRRRASTEVRAPEPPSAAGGLAASVRCHCLFGKLLDRLRGLGQVRQTHAAEHVRGVRELDVVVADDPDAGSQGSYKLRKELSPKRLRQGLSDITINLERRRRAAVWRCRTDRCVRPYCSLQGCRRAKRYLGSRSATKLPQERRVSPSLWILRIRPGVRPTAGRLILLKHERQKPSGRYRTQPISPAAIPKSGLAQSWPIIPCFPRNPSSNHYRGSWIAGRTARCCQLRRRSTRGSAGRRRSVAIEPLRLGLDVQWLSKASY